MDNDDFEASDERIHKWLTGFLEGMSGANHKWIPIIKQLCRDLNEAHNEILRQQGVTEADYNKYDWPEWTNQANSIRWAECEIRERLAKTDIWTLYPSKKQPAVSSGGKTGIIKQGRKNDG